MSIGSTGSTLSDQPWLHCLAAILKKDSQAIELLLKFVETEQPLERCLMLCYLCYQLSKGKNRVMLTVCNQLLKRIAELPT